MKETEKVFLWIIKIGLWLIPFIPFIISPAILFPFITGKNFLFRIIVEFIFVFWAGLAVLKEEYRPRLTSLFKAVTIFVAIVFFADLFSPNPYRAFFSNYERMEGFMMIFHLYLYFVMLFSVFTRRDWMIFLHSTITASALVSYIALLQKMGLRVSLQGGFRVDSTLGNPTYLAAYLLFHFWLLLMLMHVYWKKKLAVVLYGIILIFELVILYFTATRGAILALAATLMLFSATLVVWWPKMFIQSDAETRTKKMSLGMVSARKFIAAVFAVVILVPIVFFLARKTDFVQKSPALRRLTNYSFTEDTIRARFMIWNMSWKGFLDRPILGWGQENYYLVFQKYYDPGLHGQEPWFDRSHNIFFDWLVHTGIIGLLSYLSLFGITFFILIRGMTKSIISYWQGFVLVGLFVSYFLQNFFVFDNLNTYLLFFGVLAYSGFIMEGPREKSAARSQDYARAYAVSAFLFILIASMAYTLHIKPIKQSSALINTLMRYQSRAPADDLIQAFQNALSYDSFGTTEVREQIGNIAQGVSGYDHFTGDEKKRFVAFAVGELEKEISHPARDVKHMLFLGVVLNRVLAYDQSYPLRAKQILEEAYRMSPTKQMIGFELAQFYVLAGNQQSALMVLEETWRRDTSVQDAAVNLLIVAILAENDALINEVMPSLDITKLSEHDLYRLAQSFQKKENYTLAIPFYEELVNEAQRNPQYRATLAALYVEEGRFEDARRETEKAVELDPNFAEEAKVFLERIKGK